MSGKDKIKSIQKILGVKADGALLEMPPLEWLCHCTFNSPTLAKSIFNRCIGDVKMSSPLGYGFGHSIKSNNTVAPGIVFLLNLSGPFTITRFISEIIIDSIYAVICRWRKSNILQEIFKRFLPAFTHCYSPASVISEVVGSWSSTSITYSLPCFVNLSDKWLPGLTKSMRFHGYIFSPCTPSWQ